MIEKPVSNYIVQLSILKFHMAWGLKSTADVQRHAVLYVECLNCGGKKGILCN